MDFKRVSKKAVLSFVMSLALCSVFAGMTIGYNESTYRLSMERLIVEKRIQIMEAVSRLLYKTYTLSFLVIRSDGEAGDFERSAVSIMDDPAMLNVLIAPGGVVSNVYPLQGNEKLIGYDLLGEGEGNREAAEARERGELVFGGPFTLMQGGLALVGRLPVYLDRPGGKKKFWGLVSVTLKYPEALDKADLGSMEREGLAYEIWRVNPDDGQRQVIAQSGYRHKSTPYIEEKIPILNANWYFRLMPVRYWYEHPENWMLMAICLCISVLIGLLVQNNEELKRMAHKQDAMLRTDFLTGVLNRAGLFHKLKELLWQRQPFLLHYIDLNKFKQLNDTFGHSAGDMVLISFCRILESRMGEGHILSRISGDEFILVSVLSLVTEEEDEAFWQSVEEAFAAPVLDVEGYPVSIAFSRGTARFPEDGSSIDVLIYGADLKMYRHKHET